MAKPYGSSPLTDPNSLGFEVDVTYVNAVEEVIIDTSAKTIALKVVGNLTTDGATLKAVYSLIKDAWLANSTLIKYEFPMQPITDEQFELINGWNWDKTGSSGITLSTASWSSNQTTYTTSAAHGLSVGDIITVAGVTPTGYNGTYVAVAGTTGSTIVVDELTDPGTYTSGGTVANYLTTPYLIRTGGWAVKNVNGNNEEEWTGVVTLGTLGSTDQVYYQLVDQAEASVDFLLTNNVNQAIQVYEDTNADGTPDYDKTTYLKIFVREYEKLYAQSQISDIGISTLLTQAYRYPLTNSADLKIQVTTANIDTQLDSGYPSAPGIPDTGDYAKVNITYLTDFINDVEFNVLSAAASAGSYSLGDVVKDGQNRWYNCTTAGTIDATDANDLGAMAGAGTATFDPYVGERLIGATYYPFTVIIDADTTEGTSITTASFSTNELTFTTSAAHGISVGDVVTISDVTPVGYNGVYIARSGTTGSTIVVDDDVDPGSYTSGGRASRSIDNYSNGTVDYLDVYTSVQYQLQLDSDIDAHDATVTGKTANALLSFVGDNLVTTTGVYIDSFNSTNTNNLVFTDAIGTADIQFPFVASLRVNFGTNLQDDQFAEYWVFFTNANGNQFGTANAIIVDDADGIDMAGTVNPAWPTKRPFVDHTFDYDFNTQGGRTQATNAAITAVGLGLGTGQYVSATSTIARNTANSVTLTAALERNYTA